MESKFAETRSYPAGAIGDKDAIVAADVDKRTRAIQASIVMSEFWKRPKFWIGAILILWLAYIVYANFQLEPVEIRIVPRFVILQLKVSAVIIGSAVFGSVLTIALQFFWRRRSSKNGSQSAAAPG